MKDKSSLWSKPVELVLILLVSIQLWENTKGKTNTNLACHEEEDVTRRIIYMDICTKFSKRNIY